MTATYKHVVFSRFLDVKITQVLILLSCLGLAACSNNGGQEAEPEITKEALHEQLNSYIDVWAPLAPEIQRLLALESDMQLLVAELGKASNLGSAPIEQLTKQKASQAERDARNQTELVQSGQKNQKSNSVADEAIAAKQQRCAISSNFSMSKSSHCKVRVGIHLAAFKTESNVKLGWDYFKYKFGNMFINKQPLVEPIIREEGTYQSLRVGPYTSATKAHQICKQLKRQNQYCAVIEYVGSPFI